MKFFTTVCAASMLAAISASPIIDTAQNILQPSSSTQQKQGRVLIEFAPGERQWVTDEQRWELRRQGLNFFDVTDHQDFGTSLKTQTVVTFPEKMHHQDAVSDLLSHIEKDNMRKHLERFTQFYTRYYRSQYGAESSNWLFDQINGTMADAGAFTHGNATIRRFEHPWGQHSIIVSIPGRTNNTVVVSAHQDSVNLLLPSLLRSPGADDDGSGTVTILEALRVVLLDEKILRNEQENTLEFFWCSAEEGGLLGSQAIFKQYEREGRAVVAMLQQDMTGYIQGTLDAGLPESLGVITDFVDPGLTTYIKKIVTEYCDIPYVETKCGYACSDHASASKAGYPSAFVIESDFAHSNHKIHTTEDKIEYLSFDHMAQHAKLTIALAYELSFADF